MTVIARVDVFDYRPAYAHGNYVMSGGREATHEIGTLVRITTESGAEGWGEVTPLGTTYLPAYADGIRTALRTLAEAIVGEDASNLGMINARLDAALMGHGYAKSALDMACWDVFGRSVARPLVDLIGGRLQADFPLYEAVPLDTPERMAEFVRMRTDAGITRFQLKVGNRPEDDIRRTEATRAAAPDTTTIVADSNGGWNLYEARKAIRGIEDLDVLLEQPCRETEECLLAHAGSTLPLVLDESMLTVQDILAARNGGASAVNIKISRVGGLSKAVQLRDLLQSLELGVSLEDTWGGDVVSAAVSHLAASTSPEHLMNVSFFNDWTNGHVAGHRPRSKDGRGSAPMEPGLGIEVDAGALGAPLFSV